MCSPNCKEQKKKIIKCKSERDSLKVMVYPKMLWDKRKQVLTYKRLVPKFRGSKIPKYILMKAHERVR